MNALGNVSPGLQLRTKCNQFEKCASTALLTRCASALPRFRLSSCSLETDNHTSSTGLIFQGFSSFRGHQLTPVRRVPCALHLHPGWQHRHRDRCLHTPIYFFLNTLSASEMVYTLVILPQMLSSLMGMSQAISRAGCANQMFFFVTLGINNCFLLMAMGYN